MVIPVSISIIGGSGMLGRAIVQALVERSGPNPPQVWISNQSGAVLGVAPDCTVMTDNQALVDGSDVILLCVPPAAVSGLGIAAQDKLVVSVMAGIPLARISALTQATRIVRAMSSPAAALGLAYSPWIASAAVTEADRRHIQTLFDPCGLSDEVADDAQIDLFTAMTGPVPGFVAYFAACMVNYAIAQGIPPQIANRAIKQLFTGAAATMAASDARPVDHVQGMLDYNGTTAAGLKAMIAADLGQGIAAGLEASVNKCRAMAGL